jgi:hybrid cluster-associated redox disulfide protein
MKETAMEHPHVTDSLTVAEVMDRWPETIPVFLRYRMACVGCPIAPFETLAEAAAIYSLDLECLMNELQQTIRIAVKLWD